MPHKARIYVEFARALDAHEWARRHAEGSVPDASPYGLHLLGEHGYTVRFRPPARAEQSIRIARRTRRHLGGLDAAPTVRGALGRTRGRADVILCMDEEAGIPAALVPGGPPVVSGMAWLEDSSILSRRRLAVTRLALRRMAGVFTQCSAMADPLIEEFGVPVERLHTVRLGIDADHFTPRSIPEGHPIVFSVGDDRMRDHDTLVAALSTTHMRMPRMQVELATTLPVDLAPSLGVVHRRRMDQAVRDCYARAMVVAVALHPTRQGSGLTVILETMASGRPLVVTDNPGLSDYVRHGETGLLVPPNDPRAMAAAVESLLADPAKAHSMGMRGRQVVEELFTSRHMADDIDAVLRLCMTPATDRTAFDGLAVARQRLRS